MKTEKVTGEVVSGESLSIVIPALNKEEAIGSTISRCLDAKERIKDMAGLTDVEIIVVSDGSTDRTAEIAGTFGGMDAGERLVARLSRCGWHL
jgi:cellulose synthase/poly-beta-1,6-N-acetylglucosamine synthase-like glycosyltransferase